MSTTKAGENWLYNIEKKSDAMSDEKRIFLLTQQIPQILSLAPPGRLNPNEDSKTDSRI